MFAFVIIDLQTKAIFVARDRLGVKPLYYCETPNGIIIASEVAAILSLTRAAEFDEVGLRQYKKLRTFFNDHTLYKNIKMFPAATYMFDGKRNKYWNLSFVAQSPPEDEELLWLVETAIKYRKIADVPVGSYLSGGLDSTVVAGVAGELHTWTVGFESNNEFEYAQIAAKRFGTVHHEVLIDEEEFIDIAKKMIVKRKEPLSVPNEVLIYKMTKEAKQYNTVILSGEGADELFFGYDRIFRWASQIEEFDIDAFSEFYAYGSSPDKEIVSYALEPFLHLKRPIDIVGAFFQTAHLHGLLMRLDYATMLCSVEARVPFVDYRLVERLAGVSWEYKCENDNIKAPLKRAFSNIVPQTIIDRKKVGFPVPIDRIFAKKTVGSASYDKWLNFNIDTLTGGN